MNLTSLQGKRIILGVTGGIAAYKSAELIRLLRDQGADVRVVMTEAAKAFITSITFQALSGNPVHDDLLSREAEMAMGHIELARWPDLILIAPASANFIAHLTHGFADDLLSTLCLATKAPIILAPAMNQNMWLNTATQKNITELKNRGVSLLGPDEGSQACGDVGPGRMLAPTAIVSLLADHLPSQELQGVRILLTAGPTREALDPVRYLSNNSSGKMGYALAQIAANMGAQVSLISGPVSLSCPAGVHLTAVVSAQEMYHTVMEKIEEYDVFIAAAAVADYTPKKTSSQKIKKQNEKISLELILNPDILATVAQLANRPKIIGFAAETENVLENAQRKLKQKQLDMIIANEVGTGKGFDQDDNKVWVLQPHTVPIELPLKSKKLLAKELLLLIKKILSTA